MGKAPKKPRDPDAIPDEQIDIFADLVLDGNEIPQPILLAMLRRLRELLAAEMARRPAHRPRTDKAGMLVDFLVEHGKKLPAEAKKRVAKQLGKKLGTVDTAYRRYLAHRRALGYSDQTTR